MGILDDLTSRTQDIFNNRWSYRDGQIVPESKNLALGNEGVKFDGTVLYADLDDSTSLVDTNRSEFCAEVYKAFLLLCTKIIRAEGGEVRSFDGDRVMGVFLGKSKNTSAAKAGLKINYVVSKVLNPAAKSVYKNPPVVKHTVGIDTSELLAVRSGIRGSNDLVWIGRAANHAAKLNALPSTHPTRITKNVFDHMHESARFGGNPRQLMWEKITWNTTKRTIYRSTWHWEP